MPCYHYHQPTRHEQLPGHGLQRFKSQTVGRETLWTNLLAQIHVRLNFSPASPLKNKKKSKTFAFNTLSSVCRVTLGSDGRLDNIVCQLGYDCCYWDPCYCVTQYSTYAFSNWVWDSTVPDSAFYPPISCPGNADYGTF